MVLPLGVLKPTTNKQLAVRVLNEFFSTQKCSPFPLMTDQKLQTLECACYSIFDLLQILKKMYPSFSTIFIHTIG